MEKSQAVFSYFEDQHAKKGRVSVSINFKSDNAQNWAHIWVLVMEA